MKPFGTFRLWCALGVACGAPGCVDTGAEAVVVELSVVGTEIDAEFPGRGGWSLQLDRAQLAFGPLTLCGGTTAGELCDTARAEWLDSVVVDALDARARRAGDLIGVEGRVESWMFDLGFVSLLTQDTPVALSAARELSNRSLSLAGTAQRDATFVRFSALLTVAQSEPSQRGVPVVQSNASDDFGAELPLAGDELRVHFDPRPWFEQVNFDEAVPAEGCEEGCEVDWVIEPGSQAERALRTSIQVGEHPRFDWR